MTLRRLRFPILIGGGILAAAGLVYFSHSRVASQQTLGAIGKRDVYREGQDNSKDVGTPGAAPVAVAAILEGKEFQSLAKNPAFHQLLGSQQFQGLATQQAFASLLGSEHFQVLASNPVFLQLLQTAEFRQAATGIMLKTNTASVHQATTGSVHQISTGSVHELAAAMKNDSNFRLLGSNAAFNSLLGNPAFWKMAGSQSFGTLLASSTMQGIVHNATFLGLLNRSDFQSAMLQGSAASFATAAESH